MQSAAEVVVVVVDDDDDMMMAHTAASEDIGRCVRSLSVLLLYEVVHVRELVRPLTLERLALARLFSLQRWPML
jgi:hypothetical protein